MIVYLPYMEVTVKISKSSTSSYEKWKWVLLLQPWTTFFVCLHLSIQNIFCTIFSIGPWTQLLPGVAGSFLMSSLPLLSVLLLDKCQVQCLSFWDLWKFCSREKINDFFWTCSSVILTTEISEWWKQVLYFHKNATLLCFHFILLYF